MKPSSPERGLAGDRSSSPWRNLLNCGGSELGSHFLGDTWPRYAVRLPPERHLGDVYRRMESCIWVQIKECGSQQFRITHAGIGGRPVPRKAYQQASSAAGSSNMSAPELEAKPYKGSESYQVEDAEFFFGRDGEANQVIAKILSSRFSLVHAQSGAGKTSLINAQAGIFSIITEEL
jgi:hypothetical protein